jgi:hypothetical protein
VFVRCTFNNWNTYQDYPAQYVPSDYYTVSSSFGSPAHASPSAAFYGGGSTTPHYQSTHKEFDTFRFEFQLPKTVDEQTLATNTNKMNAQNASNSNITDRKELVGSIKFCICYKSGAGEFWDSNGTSNYEILQYVIDIESLKPKQQQFTNGRTNKITNKHNHHHHASYAANVDVTDVYY